MANQCPCERERDDYGVGESVSRRGVRGVWGATRVSAGKGEINEILVHRYTLIFGLRFYQVSSMFYLPAQRDAHRQALSLSPDFTFLDVYMWV